MTSWHHMSRIVTSLGTTAIVASLLITTARAETQSYRHTGAGLQAKNAYFERIATFPVYLNTDIDSETVAEIVDATDDGNTLVYTDSETFNLGFVDISDPRSPQAAGTVALGGEPTSVATAGNYALVGVNTSPSFIAPSGELVVVDIATRTELTRLDLGGQPDAVAVSPDRQYAAVVIENERDEDLGDGAPPQQPAGYVVVVNLSGEPESWSTTAVSLTGVPSLFGDDPEPEYVDINDDNIAVVTLQENNHVVLVDLVSASVVSGFSAGSVDLEQIDTEEEGVIRLTESLTDVPREPDGVSWLPGNLIATADEGDLNGGSRGFTIFNTKGEVVFTAGNTVDHTTVRIGHYPEERSGNKGNEPENVEYGRFGKRDLLFVGSERSSVVLVYRLGRNQPKLMQVLPSATGPEGLKAIPSRGLFVTASEVDSRDDKLRAGITIYQLGRLDRSTQRYPTVVSRNRRDGTPIPWGAMSGLAVNPRYDRIVYAVPDSFYGESRIFAIDTRRTPAVIYGEQTLIDRRGLLAAIAPDLVNEDATVNLDLEGIATRKYRGFWVVSEGRGTVGDEDRPVETPNLLIGVSRWGTVTQVVPLPQSVNARQQRFGLEGVATVMTRRNKHRGIGEKHRGEGEYVFVAFQREWAGDPDGQVRIGRYNVAEDSWAFYYYPLDEATSPNGGWVGLSDLAYLGNGRFAVIERDNQGNTDARVKKIYEFSVRGVDPVEDNAEPVPSFPLLKKTLVRDLISDLQAPGGFVLEKVEGLAVRRDGTALIITDNDGVDDASGETQLIKIRRAFKRSRRHF